MGELPIAPVDRLIRRAGANRVSEDAALAMSEILTDYGITIGLQAKRLAKHAGRKTVTGEDVKLAAKVRV